MAYLGRGIENLSDRVVLDSLTASATASYTLQLNSVNFVPSSAESLTVSLNGVIQAPISSYTVSGSTLTFSSALTSSDSIDFIIAERGITLQTPSAGSVGTSQLASSSVTNAKINDGEITNAKISSTAGIATSKLGTGAVLQVVRNSGNPATGSTTSTSYIDTGLSASITPTASGNKILVFLTTHLSIQKGTSHTRIDAQLYVDVGGTETNLVTSGYLGLDGTAVGRIQQRYNAFEIHTTSSTSSHTFKFRIRKANGTANETGSISYNGYAGNWSDVMTLIEIAG